MPAPGQTSLHFRIVEKMGEGGMGVVWKAVDTTLNWIDELEAKVPGGQ